jgi:Purine catabolism regulatory protein-like family/PucR C-terminal helix-turn-helix domain
VHKLHNLLRVLCVNDTLDPGGDMLDDGATTVPLHVLLTDPTLGLTRIAGPATDPHVLAIGTTELEDPTPYLSPGELFLTAGIALPADPEGIDRYVTRLATARLAAVGFGVQPVHDRVPEQLVAACNRTGIPLLRLPPQTPFVAVGHAFTNAVARKRQQEFAQEARDHAALVGATNSVDPLRAVIQRLARCNGGAVVLLDLEGRELVRAGRRLSASTQRLVQDCAVRAGADQPDGPTDGERRQLSVHVVPVVGPAEGRLVLVLVAGATPTTARRRTVATAAGLLALLVSQRHALAAGVESSNALVRLMTGDAAAAVDPLLRSAVRAPGGHWVVVRGHSVSETGRAGRQHHSASLATLRTAIGTPFLDVVGPRLTALIPCADTAPPAPPADPATLRWILGYSNPVTVMDLANGRAQADQALRTALANGRPAWVNDAAAATLGGLIPAADAEAFARALFAPLATTTANATRTLLTTLRTWLSCHGSQDRTASTLEIHRNTVRHRLTQVATILNVDLEDPDVRMTLWFALRHLPD